MGAFGFCTVLFTRCPNESMELSNLVGCLELVSFFILWSNESYFCRCCLVLYAGWFRSSDLRIGTELLERIY